MSNRLVKIWYFSDQPVDSVMILDPSDFAAAIKALVL